METAFVRLSSAQLVSRLTCIRSLEECTSHSVCNEKVLNFPMLSLKQLQCLMEFSSKKKKKEEDFLNIFIITFRLDTPRPLPLLSSTPSVHGGRCHIVVSLKLLKCCFTSTETIKHLGTGAQDVHLDFDTAPEL